MTSVPKPLKFLRPHYDTLKARLEGLAAGAPNRQQLADVVSRCCCRCLWLWLEGRGRPWLLRCMCSTCVLHCRRRCCCCRQRCGDSGGVLHCCRHTQHVWCACLTVASALTGLQVSVLAMTSSEEGSRETLKYKLQVGAGAVVCCFDMLLPPRPAHMRVHVHATFRHAAMSALQAVAACRGWHAAWALGCCWRHMLYACTTASERANVPWMLQRRVHDYCCCRRAPLAKSASGATSTSATWQVRRWRGGMPWRGKMAWHGAV